MSRYDLVLRNPNEFPKHVHDCPDCQFVGSIGYPNAPEEVHDVYFSCEGSVLIRDDSREERYASLPYSMVANDGGRVMSPRWVLAAEMVRKAVMGEFVDNDAC